MNSNQDNSKKCEDNIHAFLEGGRYCTNCGLDIQTITLTPSTPKKESMEERFTGKFVVEITKGYPHIPQLNLASLEALKLFIKKEITVAKREVVDDILKIKYHTIDKYEDAWEVVQASDITNYRESI